ncbi:MAG: S24 family peptidase [Candidatus Adiutrix sp.]|jgi:hypothetical protein|nr:S24 family peptidase [Candidatus Adiutrix sp.]
MDDVFQKALRLMVAESPQKQTEIAKAVGISTAYFNDLLHGRRRGPEEVRRRLAGFFGWRDYESFLNVGRQALGLPLATTPEPAGAEEPRPAEKMDGRGFFTVPLADNPRLTAGAGRSIPVTRSAENSPVAVHGPSLKRGGAQDLLAIRVSGPSMEPLIADGGLVLADLSRNDWRRLREGRLYVLCWNLDDGQCAVKYLRWAEKGRLLSIESENALHRPIFKPVEDVLLIGQVIQAWRDFPD